MEGQPLPHQPGTPLSGVSYLISRLKTAMVLDQGKSMKGEAQVLQ